MPDFRIYPCGDHAVTMQLGNHISQDINRRVMGVFRFLKAGVYPGIKDIIPAYHTLTIVYDIEVLSQQKPGISAYTRACEIIEQALHAAVPMAEKEMNSIRIPVCYDISLGPDIGSLARFHDITVEEVIHLHTASVYQVYMIGFMPGFAYMGSVNEKLVTPRHEKPRTSVARGSVGIAGEQTGIYPFSSPGGWQLIGQTPVNMFRVDDPVPCYLQPGDQVRFYPISLQEFANFGKA